MIPWSLVAAASIPGGEGEIRLMRRGSEFSVTLHNNELMNTRLSGSEQALARETCRRLSDRVAPDILIGGLGMGFTLRAALEDLGPAARLVVAELVPAIVTWARGPLAGIFEGCLADSRVTIVEGDVAALIGAAVGRYDAILLDVDNGPDGLTRKGNDGLYSRRGLNAAHMALRPGGLLSIWSAAPNDSFARRLVQAGFAVDDIRVRAHAGKRGARHVIWVARRI